MTDDEDRILTNLRKGVLEFCVLAALTGAPRYGRDLAATLGERGLIASEGTVYPLLARLRESGLVDTELTDPAAGRQRRYYTITAAGRERVAAFRSAWAPLRDTVDELMEIPR